MLNITPRGQFNALNNITIANIISAFIIIILVVTSIILIFIIIGGGIAVMVGGGKGDAQSAGRGRQAIMGGLIGLVIVFAAWGIINLINLFFGVNVLNLNIPNAQNP